MSVNKKPMVLYLRVDLGSEELVAGGSVAHTLGVLKGFLSNGWSVVCVSSAALNLMRGWDKVPFYALRMPRLVQPLRWKLNCLLSNVFFTLSVMRIAARYPITHLYQRHAPFTITGVLVAWWFRVPLILEYNGSEVWVERNWNRKNWFSCLWLLRWFEQRCLRSATRIVAVSQACVDELQQLGVLRAKIILQPNGVDAQELDLQALAHERLSMRQMLGCDDFFVFGFVGTFSPWHGIQQLAAMIPAVLAREPRAFFVLVGDGQLKSWLQQQLAAAGVASDRVVFTGRVAQHAAKNYLAACDAFLLPTQPNDDGTQFFGSPIKLFEYMSMAKPIIASDIAQVAEILVGIGILVPPDDPQGFVAAACALMHNNDQKLRELGNRARERVVEKHTWHTHVAEIIAAMADQECCYE